MPYGSYWSLEFVSTESLQSYDVLGIEVTGLPETSGGFSGFGYYSDTLGNVFQLYNSIDSRLTPVGTYSVGANVNAATSWSATLVRATTAVPHTLVIEPAQLSATVRATPDSADPQNTVISMSLGGSWLTDLACCLYRTDYELANLDTLPAPPAGTWSMTIANSSGEVVIEEQFEHARGDMPASVYLWRGAPVDELSTVTATFTPTGDEARNFAVTQSEPVTFTTGSTSRPEIVLPSVPEAPPTDVRSGVGIAIWLLILLALLGLGTGAACVVLAMRGRHGVAPQDGAGAEPADPPALTGPIDSADPVVTDPDVNGGLNDDGVVSADVLNDDSGGWSLSSLEDKDADGNDTEAKNES
ncbi:MAG: hypothetical protein C0444_03790 [Microbacterium sp.]|nr:hypothetical protein [Microbacterium sp.]MBA4345258.1 hypothetical protein [Microbacterium sp.]